MKKTMLSIIAGTLLVAAVAAEPMPDEKVWEAAEINMDNKEISRTRATYNLLSHAVDLWHDANLKGEEARVRQREREIVDIVENDIRMTRALVGQYHNEVDRSKAESRLPHVTRTGKADDRRDLSDDRRDLRKARTMLLVKKRLISSNVLASCGL